MTLPTKSFYMLLYLFLAGLIAAFAFGLGELYEKQQVAPVIAAVQDLIDTIIRQRDSLDDAATDCVAELNRNKNNKGRTK